MKKLAKYSIGIGDRFGREAEAQLKAIIRAKDLGVEITPVWNKSFREHDIIKSNPSETREKADQAVNNLNWKFPYFVDADHINLSNVDFFMDSADYFTIDVADYINQPIPREEIEQFTLNNKDLLSAIHVPGIPESFNLTREILDKITGKYLAAAKRAAEIYHHIAAQKGYGNFITEISMDEVEDPQTPIELFIILRLLGDIPLQTIAPKFTGKFYKGVDYVGIPALFEKEFDDILFVLSYAKKLFNLPEDLKLSIHSGSDKFTIYPVIRKLAKKHNQGFHLKTAGTTWLEEVIGMALAGGEALEMAKEIYLVALSRMEELCGPYKTVIHVDPASLPPPEIVAEWDGTKFAETLRHVPGNPNYNLNFRQLLHVGYKVAAEMGGRFISSLEENRSVISEQVIENLTDRHIIPLFTS